MPCCSFSRFFLSHALLLWWFGIMSCGNACPSFSRFLHSHAPHLWQAEITSCGQRMPYVASPIFLLYITGSLGARAGATYALDSPILSFAYFASGVVWDNKLRSCLSDSAIYQAVRSCSKYRHVTIRDGKPNKKRYKTMTPLKHAQSPPFPKRQNTY